MDSRRRLVGSSTKMYLTTNEVAAWVMRLRQLLEPVTGVEVFVLPPFVSLPKTAELLRGTRIAFGAQNMHWADRGPHTGEVSPLMLAELGATFVELGHAERRRDQAESDESVNLKVLASLRHGLRPIVCVGEDSVSSTPDDLLRRQVATALAGVQKSELEHVVIAYEPVWAIGQAAAAPASYVFERHRAIRRLLIDRFGAEAGNRCTIIYGGSVMPRNAGSLLKDNDVQGLFVGRSALDPESFAQIVAAARPPEPGSEEGATL